MPKKSTKKIKKPEKITKKLTDKLLSFNGHVRGVVFQTDAEYIIARLGKGAIKLVEKRLKELGQTINYNKVKATNIYPLGLRVLSLLVIKEVFKWTDRDIIDMGDKAPTTSLLIRLLLKFFISTSKAMSKASEAWSKHYDIGELVIKEVNESKHRVIVQLKGIDINSIFYTYLTGYFRRFVQLTRPNDKVKIKQNKCTFKGDSYHEFKIYW